MIMMIMKKQQPWMFKQLVFSMINSSSSSSSISIFNNVLRQRPFCSAAATTTNTSCLSTVAQPPPPPSVSNNKQFNILLEKKLPLLIVPYDHITQKKYVLCPPKRYLDSTGDYNVCDGTLGFISLFHDDDDDDDDDELIVNKKKKKKKKKKKEVYDVYLPEIAKRRICGSSEGWLVTVHHSGEFQLLNPLTRVIVHLPHFTTLPLYYDPHFRDNFIYKVVTNTTTTTTNSTTTTTLPAAEAATVVVMAIYSGDASLAFCRRSLSSSSSTGNGTTTDEPAAAAASAWIKIPVKTPMSSGWLPQRSNIDGTEIPTDITYEVIDGVTHWVTMIRCWLDITFYKGNFYAVGPRGNVGVVKGLDGPSPFVQFLIDGPAKTEGPKMYFSQQNYLVETSSSSSSSGGGDLLMVMKNIEETETEEEEEEEVIFERPYRTNGFRVLKLDFNNNNGPPSWEEVTDLGKDCALFIGYNHSFSFFASKIPGSKGNCIYFTDNHRERILTCSNGGHDIGVYNLEDGSCEELNYETCSSQLFMPPPVWYVPN